MASDWRVVPEPLAKLACGTCGLTRRRSQLAAGESLYASGYTLYAHAPGGARERERQEHYARWIADAVGRSPARVLDVGCGNGSLLLALREHWPGALLQGCDPSAESVAHGSGLGLRLWQGTARGAAEAKSDIVISVNVIEHTSDPRGFVRALRDALAPDGLLVLVCPDGGRPGSELLFADHLFSFDPSHLEALLAREGLRLVRRSAAVAALGEFQMVVAERAEAPVSMPLLAAPALAARRAYLESWRELDARLQLRVPASVVCFGIGEAAGLLRAYASGVWRRVRACTADDASGGTFADLPVIALDAVRPEETMLLGVRPSDQALLVERLRSRCSQVVAWNDLIKT